MMARRIPIDAGVGAQASARWPGRARPRAPMIVLALATGLAMACGGEPRATADAGSAPPATALLKEPPPPPDPRRIEPDTPVPTQLVEPLSSLADKPGQSVFAVVLSEVKDAAGNTLFSPGARIELRLAQFDVSGPASAPRARVKLEVVALHVNGGVVPLQGTVDSLPYLVRDRNIIVERATPVTLRIRGRP